jgi:hypothetical protein
MKRKPKTWSYAKLIRRQKRDGVTRSEYEWPDGTTCWVIE